MLTMRSRPLLLSLAVLFMAAMFLAFNNEHYGWAVFFAYISGNFVGKFNTVLERS